MVRDVLGAGESLMILALYLSPAAGWAGIEWTCFTTDRSPISNPAAPTARSADNEPAGESAASIVSTPIAFRRPQQGFDLLCDAPDKFGRDVLIPCRHGHLGPSHELHHGTSRHTENKEHSRRRVTRVVQSGISHPCGLEQCLPFVMISPWIDRAAVGLGEYPTTFLPEFRCMLALPILCCLMLTQCPQ
jgi:hypothetical protein